MNPQQIKLSLFETATVESKPNAIVEKNEQPTLTKEKVTESISNVLSEFIPVTTTIPGKPTQNLKNSLDDLFPEQQTEEKNIKKSKEILGCISDEFTTEQLRDISTEVIFLVKNSLDAFERSIFEGITLKELLHEKSL
jgi:hypothetical protein